MERSFSKEVEALRLGAGETFRGEGILAVTKALLQSGVSYVGGYQGAPVSHLLDVMVEAKDLLGELGVHVETCTNEAAAAAMLGASINYPLRGAVTWKSIVGTNVAADALSNLASPGVIGGALIVLGEDYGEGASVIQERSYAYAMKSSIWLLDPRPDLPAIVHMVEKGFELSEASHAPVMLDLRVRACHLTGEFTAKDNKPGLYNAQHRLAGPVRFEYGRLSHPPATFAQERLKIEQRLPAAQKFICEQKLNELIAGEIGEIGIIVLGGLTNGLLRALARLDLADLYGVSRIPIYVLNVAYPLVPKEVGEFCAGKRAVLVVEEGSPNYVEQQINVILRNAGADTRVYGKGCLPASGDYTSEVLLRGIAAFAAAAQPTGIAAQSISRHVEEIVAHRTSALAALHDIPARPPNFCTSRAPSFCRDQAGAARIRTGPYQRRHRLPFLRDLCAVLARQFHSWLRHVAGERGRGRSKHGEASDRGDGRWRFLAQRVDYRRRLERVQQGRRRARDHAERLRLGNRPAIFAVEQRASRGRIGRNQH
ncbi:MAG: hypothetical protein WAV38_15535 [Xanthobacteraceae bacterium]